MTKKEYMQEISNIAIKSKKVDKLHFLYSFALPNVIERIVSFSKNSVFFDDNTRVLSFDEIITAQRDLQIDFADRGLIPLFDCGDNDFIVYNFKECFWAMFNIVDETVFKKRNSIEEVLF